MLTPPSFNSFLHFVWLPRNVQKTINASWRTGVGMNANYSNIYHFFQLKLIYYYLSFDKGCNEMLHTLHVK